MTPVPFPPADPAPVSPDPVVQPLVDQIVAEFAPLRVILFGSRATGTARPDSDVDLLVVMPDGTRCRQAMAAISARLPVGAVDVDVLVTTPTVLERRRHDPGYVYREALRTGCEIHPTLDG